MNPETLIETRHLEQTAVEVIEAARGAAEHDVAGRKLRRQRRHRVVVGHQRVDAPPPQVAGEAVAVEHL